MMPFLSRNSLAVILASVLVAGVVWYAFYGGESSTVLLTTQSEVGGENVAEIGIVETLLALRAVSLSGTIFSDPAFGALRDFGTQIVPEPVGRPNPFAPRQSGEEQSSDAETPILPGS